MQINTTSDALDNLNKKLGGADIEIEPSTNKVDALKKIYKTLGGTDDVKGLSTVYQVLEKITEVAEGGGGGSLPSVTSADEGKVLTVDEQGKWAAENRNGICIETEGTLNKSYNDLVSMVNSGILPFVYFSEGDTIAILPLNQLAGGESYEATFLTAGGATVIYSAENATSPLVTQD